MVFSITGKKDMFNPFKYLRKRKVGLALGSGSVKGFAHIAVIEYLQSLGIPIHYIAGSSIGAMIGAIHSIGSLTSFKNDALKLTKRDLFSLFDPLIPRAGLMQGKRLFDLLRRYIPADARIEDLPIPLSIMATDFRTGRSVCFRTGNVLEAVRASISIPGIFVPVKYRGTWLIDGGVANPLPVNVVRHMGAGLTIAVNLHPRVLGPAREGLIRTRLGRMSMVIDSDHLAAGDSEDLLPDALKEKRSEFPSIFETINQAIDIQGYINTMLMLKYNRPTVLIEPDATDVGTLDFTRIPQVIREGHQASLRARGTIIRRVKIWV